MKKLLFTFVLTLLPLIASAYDIAAYNADGVKIYYNLINGELWVTYGDKNDKYVGNVVIPEQASLYKVTNIGTDAFRDCSGLTSITIPNSVTSIRSNAFYGCSGLTSITIPNSVTSIGSNAFYGCSGLTSVAFHCKEIGTWFSNISSIKEVTIGEEVTSIGAEAFRGCSGLEKIVIPAVDKWCSVNIGANALPQKFHIYSDEETEITSVDIPEGVTSVNDDVFNGCAWITSVSIPNSVTSIGNWAFENCTGLTSITIVNSVRNIGTGAFYGCSGLTSVTIPNSVTSIGGSAFNGCSGLTSIVVDSANTVYDSRDNCNAIINTSTNELIAGCKNTVIPNTVTSIRDNAFRKCSSLTSITIPSSVTSIGGYVFSGCSGLTSIVVDSANTVYDSRDNCNAIINTSTNELIAGCKNTVIPNTVTSIGGGAFEYCSGLTSVTIPNSVTSIGERAFNGCSGLTSIDSKIADVFIINDNTFSNETYNNVALHILGGLKSKYQQVSGWKQFKNIAEDTNVFACGPRLTCTYSDSDGKLTIQGDGAMWDYSSSTSVPWNSYKTNISTIIIEDGATSIGDYAFNGCTNLYSVTFGKGITSVGGYAFQDCSNVKKVIASDVAAWCGIDFGNILANPIYYAKKLYQDKTTEITALTISDKVTHIGSYAFSRCKGLTSVTFGNSVRSIGNGAFNGCSGLTSITIPNSVTSIGDYAFNACI